MKYKHYSLTRLPERKPGLYLALFLLVCGAFPAAVVTGQDKVKSTDSEQAETAATDATVPQPTELLNLSLIHISEPTRRRESRMPSSA